MAAPSLTPLEELDLARLLAWLPTAPLPFGPYSPRPGTTVEDNMRNHAYLRRAAGVKGQRRRALLCRLRELWVKYGDVPAAADDGTRVDVTP